MKALTAEGAAESCLVAYVVLALLGVLSLALLGVLSYDTSAQWLLVPGFVLLPVIVWGTRNQRGLAALFVGFTLIIALHFARDADRSTPARLKARLIGYEAELAKLRAELEDRSGAEGSQGPTTTPE